MEAVGLGDRCVTRVFSSGLKSVFLWAVTTHLRYVLHTKSRINRK